MPYWKDSEQGQARPKKTPFKSSESSPAKLGTQGPKWKSSAKEDGVRAQGPTARNSGKAPFPGVMPGTGDVGGQENPRRTRRQDYAGGRSEVQPREKGVRY